MVRHPLPFFRSAGELPASAPDRSAWNRTDDLAAGPVWPKATEVRFYPVPSVRQWQPRGLGGIMVKPGATAPSGSASRRGGHGDKTAAAVHSVFWAGARHFIGGGLSPRNGGAASNGMQYPLGFLPQGHQPPLANGWPVPLFISPTSSTGTSAGTAHHNGKPP